MFEFVEPQVRRLVADLLGVGHEELVADVSLREDLAADSLDLVELAMALEGAFAIVVPERILDQVRTYTDLVHATGLLIRARREAEARGAEPAERVWTRIVLPGDRSGDTLERTDWLTPYTVETIAEDAARAGAGARVEVTIAATSDESFVRAERRFARLGSRGVLVTVRRDDGPPAACPPQIAVARLAARDPLLDRLTGARTAVTATGYGGDDRWQGDRLIARVGHGVTLAGGAAPVPEVLLPPPSSSAVVAP